MIPVRTFRLFFSVVVFLAAFNLYGQETKKNNADESLEEFIKRDDIWRKEQEERWRQRWSNADGDSDTLYILPNSKYVSKSENIIKGKPLFFRRTPLSLKNEWTNLFPALEPAYAIPPDVILTDGVIKGYTLTWLLRNDSLFIKDITLQKVIHHPEKKLPRDTIITRLENFTGGKFKDGLMFVDWISGDFDVITRNPRNSKISSKTGLEYPQYTNYLFKFEKGQLVDFMDIDNRDSK